MPADDFSAASAPPEPVAAALALLEWQIAMGADEAIGEVAPDRLAPPPPPTATTPAPVPRPAMPVVAPAIVAPPGALAESLAEAAQSARLLAAGAESVEALAALVAGFDGCPLKRTATNTVFIDGNPAAPVMIVGEAPGADEDRIGRPFVGRAGQLLDRMLAAIGLDRGAVYIANIVPWRPPGNRDPTPQEVAMCKPFLERQIELADPDILVCLGGASARELLGVKEGILRSRGRWFPYRTRRDIRALATLHPAYLLRSPLQKRLAWRDFRALRRALDEKTEPA